MHVLRVRNVHEALPLGLTQLAERGIPMPSRAGDVLMLPEPVTTHYRRPAERVIFWPQRDANPFFHIFEALWMLAGRNDVVFLKRFVGDFDRFSDDGKIIHGAYGYRWLKHWTADIAGDGSLIPLNQLRRIVSLLQKHPNSRRAVLTMWDPEVDLREDESGRDFPCNTQAYFWNLAGRLQMTVTCRSNDIIWGCYGANAVHFSILQEYLAAQLGWEVGSYYQISNNFHAYVSEYRKLEELVHLREPSPYDDVEPYPMIDNPKTWDRDLALFLEDPSAYGYDNPWFGAVAKPMWFAHKAWRNRADSERYEKALDIISQCKATDWRRAGAEWLGRRRDKAGSAGVLRDR